MKGIAIGTRDMLDQGCELAPSCLECPFPRCKEDDASIATYAKHLPVIEALPVPCTGADVQRIAQQFNMTSRNVYRIIRLMEKYDTENA
jgi:hypothetical protein